MMQYKGYTGYVEYDDEAKIFHGRVLGINDVVNFEGESVKEIERSFQESVDDYLDFCKQRGEKPEKPFSGKFLVRLDPDVHRKITVAAQSQKKSLNAWIAEILKEAVAAQ